MTPHYDLKQQEKNNGVLGAGLAGVTKFLSYIWGGGGVEYVFPTGWGGGVVKIFAYRMKYRRVSSAKCRTVLLETYSGRSFI